MYVSALTWLVFPVIQILAGSMTPVLVTRNRSCGIIYTIMLDDVCGKVIESTHIDSRDARCHCYQRTFHWGRSCYCITLDSRECRVMLETSYKYSGGEK